MDYRRHLKRFGIAVAECRRRSKLSREELARRADMPLEQLALVEHGAPDGLGLREICRIARALDMTPGELMRRYEKSVGPACWWSGRTEVS